MLDAFLLDADLGFLQEPQFWETAGKFLVVGGTLFTSARQLRAKRKSGRKAAAQLREDAELLGLVKEGTPGRELVERRIRENLQIVYGPKPPRRMKRFVVSPEFYVNALFFVGLVTWTVYLSWGGFSWWSLLTGFFAVASLGATLGTVFGEPSKAEPSSRGGPRATAKPSRGAGN